MSGVRATRFISFALLGAGLLGLNLLCSAAQNQPPASSPPSAAEGTTTDEGAYGDTYTAEELAAMDTALHAVNMDRTDLTFKKDYAKGYECFPVVREMMADPLSIAAWMDKVASLLSDPEKAKLSSAYVASWGSGILFQPFEQGLTAADTEYLMRTTDQAEELFKERTGKGSDEFDSVDETSPEALELFLVSLETFLIAMQQSDSVSADSDWLREHLPAAMAWHDVFNSPSNSSDAVAESEQIDTKELYEAATVQLLTPQQYMASMFTMLTDPTELASISSWPTDKPRIIDTAAGRICIGTPDDDTYTGDFAVLIEPGGNDHYVNCRIGAAYGARTYVPRLGPDGEPTGASADYSPLGEGRVGYFADLGGDDYYDCGDTDITLGAAVLGVAAFYDLGSGNDRYFAGHCSLGAAMAGVATFYDDGGSDYYSGKTYTQGAAGFGIGLMYDDSVQPAQDIPTDVETPDPIDLHPFDNDYYTAWSEAQAFARTRGVALCINRRGNEVYHAGGVYLHAPLFADRYQSFSQGFAIGERDIDYAGGIAMLADYAGNDRYLGDIYNQGVGYWYSAGFLYDEAGNDLYEMTQYGQGSGIHLAIGGLIDNAGNDTYVMHSGLGQGGSHDFAASVLMDRGGNDHYMGMTSCNGTGLTNSVGLFFDRSGDDTYAARSDGYFNGGRPDRNSGSIGLFVDLAGKDDYLGIASDGSVWSSTFYGAGIDITPPPAPEPEFASEGAANVVTGAAPIPEVCSYEGPLTQEVFDELWEISVRWEVGDNRYIVPEARKRIMAFGPEVIPYLDGKMDNDNSGLAQRAYVDILVELNKQAPEPVAELLIRNAGSESEIRRNVALYLIGELKLTACESAVVAQMSNPDPAIQRRAIGVLGLIGSHAADAQLIAMLDPAADEAQLRIALTTLTDLKVDCYAQLRPLLDYPMVTVRETLINQLVKHWDLFENHVSVDVQRGMLAYGKDVYSAEQAAQHKQELERLGIEQMDAPIKAEDAPSPRALRTLLTVLARETDGPRMLNVAAGMKLLGADDWGLRADAVRLVKHWQQLQAAGVEVTDTTQYAYEQLEALKAAETDPYVKFVAGQ